MDHETVQETACRGGRKRRELPDGVWEYKILAFLSVSDADAYRSVSKSFRSHVSRARALGSHGDRLRREFHASATLRLCSAHHRCPGFDAADVFKHVREEFVRGAGAESSPERALVAVGAKHLGAWDLAPRAIAWGLRRLAPRLFATLWRGAPFDDAECQRLNDILREAGSRLPRGGREPGILLNHVRARLAAPGSMGPENMITLTSMVAGFSPAAGVSPPTGASPAAAFARLVGALDPPDTFSHLRALARKLAIIDSELGVYTCSCMRQEAIQAALGEHLAALPGDATLVLEGAVVTAAEAARAIAENGLPAGGIVSAAPGEGGNDPAPEDEGGAEPGGGEIEEGGWEI